MGTLAKICGLTRADDARAAVAAGADMLGVIVEAKSSRRMSADDAAALVAQVPASWVAVTVDPDDALVASVRNAGFGWIQLHGSETMPRVAEVAASGLKVIKAVSVATRDEIKLATEYSGAADLVLFDAKAPAGEAQRGGHGLRFDWNVLRGAPLPKRWVLAGGLSPENVAQAVAMTGAPIVDVSSGVESAPGVKSAQKMEEFMEQLRG